MWLFQDMVVGLVRLWEEAWAEMSEGLKTLREWREEDE